MDSIRPRKSSPELPEQEIIPPSNPIYNTPDQPVVFDEEPMPLYHDVFYVTSSDLNSSANEPSPDEGWRSKPQSKATTKDYSWRYWALGIGAVVFLLIAITFGFFSWKIHHVSSVVTIENNGGHSSSWMTDMKTIIGSLFSSDRKELRGESDGRINVLLLGRSGENNPGKNLTDTIMIASINTQTKRVAFLSLPRDLYVRIPNTQNFAKINSVLQYSLNQHQEANYITQTIETVTGTPIHYYVILDFTGFQKVIDDIGGITVDVERDMYDPRYPGPNYSYETFDIKKGVQHLDGATALKYARERHADPDGDFGRARRQQQILQAVKNKTFSAGTLLNVFAINRLLTTLETHIQTNIDIEEAESFFNLTKTLDTQNITNAVVDAWEKDSLLRVSHVFFNNMRAFILVPRAGNFSEIQDLAQNIFDQNQLKARKESIEREAASILIVNQSNDNQLDEKIRQLLKEELGMKNVTVSYAKTDTIRNDTVIDTNPQGSKPFTLDELVKRIPAKVGNNFSPNDNTSKTKPDFVIHLGNDIVDSYRYDRDSVDDYRNAAPEQEYMELLNTK